MIEIFENEQPAVLFESKPIEDAAASETGPFERDLAETADVERAATVPSETFLDDLGIPQDGGLIDEGFDLQPPQHEILTQASEKAYERFETDQVDLYLAALVALDPQTWEGLRSVMSDRVGSD